MPHGGARNECRRTVQALSDAGVEFVIIGGWSAILHGSTLGTTYALDICFSPRADNLRRLLQALAPYHPRSRDLPTSSPFTWDEATLRKGTVLRLATDLGETDLWAEVTGLGSFENIQAGSILVDAFGRRVWTLDLRTLIKAKRAAGRQKDLNALPELESLLEAGEP